MRVRYYVKINHLGVCEGGAPDHKEGRKRKQEALHYLVAK